MSRFEWFIASRYIWSKKSDGVVSLISLFSLLGIALGVATLIVVMSVMNGFHKELSGKILDYNSHLSISSSEGPYADYAQDLKKLGTLPEIADVIPMIDRQVMLHHRKGAQGILIKALPYENLQRRKILYGQTLEGSLASFSGRDPVIALGAKLASALGLGIGDSISLISPEGEMTPFGRMPKMQSFKVVAIVGCGLHEVDNSTAYLPLGTAQSYFGLEQAVDHLDVFFHKPEKASFLIPALQALLSKPLRFLPWTEAHASFFQVLKVERNVMFLILSFIITIAAFNIVSGLTMFVKDKTSSIAILKTMGASSRSISFIFSLVGTSVGVFGTFLGVILGLVTSWNLESIRQFLQKIIGTTLFDPEFYFLSELPVCLEAREIVFVALYSILLSFLATLYPAWRASRLNPVEALRHE